MFVISVAELNVPFHGLRIRGRYSAFRESSTTALQWNSNPSSYHSHRFWMSFSIVSIFFPQFSSSPFPYRAVGWNRGKGLQKSRLNDILHCGIYRHNFCRRMIVISLNGLNWSFIGWVGSWLQMLLVLVDPCSSWWLKTCVNKNTRSASVFKASRPLSPHPVGMQIPVTAW